MAGRSRRSHSLEGSVLLKQLGQAHQYISGLEEYIRERERNYQSAITQLRVGERRDSGVGMRRGGRRVGRSHDIFMQMRGMGSFDHGDQEDQEALHLLLGKFVKLKILRVEEGAENVSVPFALRRMVGQEYHIGPEGASIGVAPHCTITLPRESGLEKEHCYIGWEDDNEQSRSGCFVLENLTDNGALCLCSETYSESAVFPLSLTCGVRFMTGQIVWQLSALPKEVDNLANAFYLARNGKLTELKDLIESLCPPILPTLTVVEEEGDPRKSSKLSFHQTGFDSQKGFDVNAVYTPPSYKDEENAFALSETKRPMRQSVAPTTPRPAIKHTPQLLLHIAINNADMKMINYLLDKGADVNLTAGEMSYNAVHLAALRNHAEVMSVLLMHGADLELRNVEHHTPLSLTTNYEIRKLLLNSIMLCAAAEAGDSSEVSRLLSSNLISPNVRGLRHKNPLHLAAAAGQASIVELLLVHNVNVDARGGSRHRTALHYASAGGHSRVVELLLAVGASELVRDTGGYTPLNVCQGDACRLLNKQPLSLCLAVQSGDVEAVREIVGEEGDGVNLRNDQGHTPLHLACILGNIEMVVLLVSHGADVNLHGGSDGWTPLLYSAMAGHSDAVEFLLSVGADPQKGNSNGDGVRETLEKVEEELNRRLSELQKRKRSESLVESMLLPRHSINMLGRQISSPTPSVEQELVWIDKRLTQLHTSLSLLTTPAEKLLAAFESRNLTNFNYILEEGKVDVNGPADRLTTIPILVRVCEESMLHYAGALLEAGANPNLVGAEDEVPLLVAASNGDTPLLKLLVNHRADVNVQSTDRQMTALHMAAICNDIESVRYLVSAGADRKLSNSSGELPFDCTTVLEIRQLLAEGTNRLLVAVSSEDALLVKKLVSESSIDVNTEFCHNGYTVLHEACEGESEELVELLLKLGANVNKRGGLYQCTPLHITSRANNIDVTRLLLSHGAKLDITDYEGKVPLEVACTNQMRKLLVEARQPALVSHEPVSDGEKRCLICMDNLINTIILPCGHQAFCKECVTKITQCALDRKPIREVIPLYRS